MISPGHWLYNLYAQAQKEMNNCEVDSWVALSPQEQGAWERTAELTDQ